MNFFHKNDAEYRKYLAHIEEEQKYRNGKAMFSYFAEAEENSLGAINLPTTQQVFLVPRLVIKYEYNNTRCWLEFRFGSEKLYMLRNLRQFMYNYRHGDEITLGKNTTIKLNMVHWGDELSAQMYEFIAAAHKLERGMLRSEAIFGEYISAKESYIFSGKQFRLTPEYVRDFLEIMGDRSFEMKVDDDKIQKVQWKKGNPPIKLKLTEHENGDAKLALTTKDVIPVTNDSQYLYWQQTVYKVSDEFARNARAIWRTFNFSKTVYVKHEALPAFFAHVLPQLELCSQVAVPENYREQYMVQPFQAELYIEYLGDGVTVRPKYIYGEVSYNPLLTPIPPQYQGKTIIRNIKAENEIEIRLAQFDFTVDHGSYIQLDEEKSYDFLNDGISSMPDWVEVFFADTMPAKPIRPLPRVTAGVSVNDMNLLEVSFNVKDVNIDELLEILESYRQKRRYHRLRDKSYISLGEQQLQAIIDFTDKVGLNKQMLADADGTTFELPLSNAMYLDELAREDERLHLERSRKFRQVVREIRHPEEGEAEIPDSLRGVLRDYQEDGFRWLSALADYHLGGILADDMGLGKTLQVLTFLLSRQDDTLPPSLIVAPTSLMYNWLDEIERFTPQLKAQLIIGVKTDREAILAQLDNSYDIVITTYNMLKRDIKLYEKKQFRYCFLDEAQHIKNPTTQNARAVKKLSTMGYFALTGTPIENTLTELWSIFDFLMPGYLLSHKNFKAQYEVPIVREENKHTMKNLRQHIMPFILRRMKKDVLTELPDKVERKMLNEMTEIQAKVYKAWFIKSQKEFADVLAASSFSDSRIKILAILTRLRQIACDPATFLEDYDGGSGKLDMLEEVISEAVAGHHRLLVFSQFTTMLKRISDRLTQLGIDFYYLDGSVPAVKRMQLVKAFNESTTPVFLISLKAGGTGLNLIGADMVIHFDPWWNPAVEDQATDRAYRLGQKNNVQVLKFITKDTIEEKIYQLQEKKKGLIDQMIQPGDNFLSKLTEQEIRDLFVK